MHILKNIFPFVKTHKIITIIIIIFIALPIYFFRPKPAAPVEAQTVKRGRFVQSVSVSGTVQAKNSADLTFITGGTLVYLGIKKGDYVKQYQTIAMLDERTAQKNLEASLIDYSKQRNDFDQTNENNQNRTPQEALNDDMKRILENNQYDLNKSVNSVELQNLAKQQSVITTPIAGIVTRTDVDTTGLNVTPLTTFSIVDPNSVVFDMDVDEADIGNIKNGQKVTAVLDAFPDTTLHLTVDSVDFVSHDTSTGGTAYTVEVKMLQNNNYQYKVGMNGNGDIITNQKDAVLSVPISALDDNNNLYVETAPNVFEKRKVKLGLQNDTNTEVISGLEEGEKVALDPTSAAQHVKK